MSDARRIKIEKLRPVARAAHNADTCEKPGCAKCATAMDEAFVRRIERRPWGEKVRNEAARSSS